MLPMTGWLILLLLFAVLAWRALNDGGWFWAIVGGLALACFAGEIWAAFPKLAEAIRAETVNIPVPRLHWHSAALAALVFLRPTKRRTARTS